MERRHADVGLLCWQQLERGIIDYKERRRRVIEWLRENPDTYEGLARRGFFKEYKTAQRVVSKAFKKGQIKCIGTVKGENGRPALVFCGSRSSSIEHDLLGTELRGAYEGVSAERGGKLDHNCDLILHFSPSERGYVEIDTTKVSLNKQKLRWRKYVDVQGVVLVVTTGPERMRNLQNISEEIGAFALFGILDEIIADPWGEVYETINGVRVTVEEPWRTSE